MPPKVKVTGQEIVNAAVELIRREGEAAINARNIATVLGCSTQPIFSNFSTMEELRIAVVQRVNEICYEYIKREIESGQYPEFKASGMAYIRFASEQKELFKLLYMRDRTKEEEVESDPLGDKIQSVIKNNTGLSEEDVKVFHLEMWAYVHGIAAMAATGFAQIDWQLVSRMLTDAYLGLRKQYGLE